MKAPVQMLSTRVPRSTARRSASSSSSGKGRDKDGPSAGLLPGAAKMQSRSSSTAGSAIRSAPSSRSSPQEGSMVKSLCARTGGGSPATTDNS